MPEFLLNALLAGIALSLVVGPVGCFIVWRRVAFMGDAIAHSALTGVAFALLLDVFPFWGILLIALSMAFLLSLLQRQKWLPLDTWLAILSHSILAIGLVVFSLAKGGVQDLQAYLFGDILTLSSSDVHWLFVCVLVTLGVLVLVWRTLLLVTVNEDLAQAEGVRVRLYNIIFMLIVAFVVSYSVRTIGAILFTAMMILPAASARALSRNPAQMVFASIAFGMVAVCTGLWGSLTWDTPTGPFIVVAAVGLFLISQTARAFIRR